jgi:hypothetical protein
MNPHNSPKDGSHWADQQGRKVQFYSRNTKAKTVIWHPRFYFWYRTSADALKAKAHWETKHRILWPQDIAREKTPMKREEKMRVSVRVCRSPRQQPDLFSEARV